MNFCGPLVMHMQAILSIVNSNNVIVLGKKEYLLHAVFAGVEHFVIEVSSATQNCMVEDFRWDSITVNGFVKYCESFVCASGI